MVLIHLNLCIFFQYTFFSALLLLLTYRAVDLSIDYHGVLCLQGDFFHFPSVFYIQYVLVHVKDLEI